MPQPQTNEYVLTGLESPVHQGVHCASTSYRSMPSQPQTSMAFPSPSPLMPQPQPVVNDSPYDSGSYGNYTSYQPSYPYGAPNARRDTLAPPSTWPDDASTNGGHSASGHSSADQSYGGYSPSGYGGSTVGFNTAGHAHDRGQGMNTTATQRPTGATRPTKPRDGDHGSGCCIVM